MSQFHSHIRNGLRVGNNSKIVNNEKIVKCESTDPGLIRTLRRKNITKATNAIHFCLNKNCQSNTQPAKTESHSPTNRR